MCNNKISERRPLLFQLVITFLVRAKSCRNGHERAAGVHEFMEKLSERIADIHM